MLRPSDATPADPERFVSRAGGLFQHVERVAAWSRRTLAATLESMPGVDGATTVSLATYLEVARRVGSKDDRFSCSTRGDNRAEGRRINVLPKVLRSVTA